MPEAALHTARQSEPPIGPTRVHLVTALLFGITACLAYSYYRSLSNSNLWFVIAIFSCSVVGSLLSFMLFIRALLRTDDRAVVPPEAWWIVGVIASIYWWHVAGDNRADQSISIVALSVSSFVLGLLFGFVFTTFGEELSTIGKVRDWLIGGVTGIAVSQIIDNGGFVKRLLLKFVEPQTPATEFAIICGTATVYFGGGFLFMFFQRELVINKLLAKSRSERDQLSGTIDAGLTIRRLQIRVPLSILSGVSEIDSVLDKDALLALRKELYSDMITEFLKQADDAMTKGVGLDWDTVSKVANIYYYRASFDKVADSSDDCNIKKAMLWITRALTINPLHADLTMKYAATLTFDKQYRAAVVELQRLKDRADAPSLVRQWLGLYLLYLPGHTLQAIKYSQQYIDLYPEDSDAYANLACGYGQLHAAALKENDDAGAESNRREALKALRIAVKRKPSFAARAHRLTKDGEDFQSFADDPEFVQIVGTAVQ